MFTYNVMLEDITLHDGEQMAGASQASRQPLPIWHPVVGRNIFVRESDVHAKSSLNDVGTFYSVPEISA